MFHLVWLVKSDTLFEEHWIRYLLGDLEYKEVHAAFDDVIENGVFVFNHSMDYESYFEKYERLGIPFAAIHLSDECLSDDYTFYTYSQCKFVFRNYYHPHASRMPNVVTFGLGYKKDFATLPVGDCHPDYYHWCFAGNIHDTSRVRSFMPFTILQPYRINFTTSGFNASNSLSLVEYKKWLIESKFCLCPIGQSNIDTFRLYEALECGSIPVVLSKTSLQDYTPSYWHALFDEYAIPFIMAPSMQECCSIIKSLIDDIDTFYKKKEEVNQFWKCMKQKWRLQLQELVLRHIAFGNA